MKSPSTPPLLKLLRSLDLIIICLLSSFVIKGAWFPLIILVSNGACLLVILRKVSLKLSYAASLSLIFKHLSKGASVISFRKSASLNCIFVFYIVFLLVLTFHELNGKMS